MSGLTTGVGGFLIIAWTVAVWILYHKVFTVYYFNLGAGLGKELIGSLIAGIILASITVYLYWVVAAAAVIAGLVISQKIPDPSKKKMITAVFVVLAVAVFFIGRSIKSEANSNSSTKLSMETTIDYSDSV